MKRELYFRDEVKGFIFSLPRYRQVSDFEGGDLMVKDDGGDYVHFADLLEFLVDEVIENDISDG